MRLWLSLLVVLLSMAGVSRRAAAEETPVPKFESDIAPSLATRCLKCHGDGKLEAGLDLRRRFLILKGGDSGAGFVAEKPDESLLIQKIMAVVSPLLALLNSAPPMVALACADAWSSSSR